MKAQTISIFSTKNGVGCSTLAYNLGLFLNQKILEPDNGLLHIFGKVRAYNPEGATYYVDKISNVKPGEYKNCVIDAGNHLNRTTLEKVIQYSDVILVPSFYDHTTLIHTVSSLKIIYNINPNAIIIIVFNRLDPSDKTTEKEYTKYAWNRMLQMLNNENIQAIIRIAYIRANFLYFEFLEGGYCFLDHYFNTSDIVNEELTTKKVAETTKNKVGYAPEMYTKNIHELSPRDARMMDARIDEDTKEAVSYRLKVGENNIHHLFKLDELGQKYAKKYSESANDYEPELESEKVSSEDAKEAVVYSRDVLFHNRKPVRDILELLEKMNVIR